MAALGTLMLGGMVVGSFVKAGRDAGDVDKLNDQLTAITEKKGNIDQEFQKLMKDEAATYQAIITRATQDVKDITDMKDELDVLQASSKARLLNSIYMGVIFNVIFALYLLAKMLVFPKLNIKFLR